MYSRWKIYTWNDSIPEFHRQWNLLNQGHAFSIEWNTDLNRACWHTNGDDVFTTDEVFASKIGTLD
jgi:hypothetical protein